MHRAYQTDRTTGLSATCGRAAFTLLEILVVLLIIGILLSIGFSQLGSGQGGITSLPSIEALFSQARTQAIGNATRVRVVIHNDPTDEDYPDRHLRFFAIAVPEEGDPTDPDDDSWVISSTGTFLAQGVFFDKEASARAATDIGAANPAGDDDPETGFGKWGSDQIDFPGPPDSLQDCLFYEFNSEGICVIHGTTTPGGVVVLGRGVRNDGEDPVFRPADKVGFVVWRNCHSTP